MSKEDNMITGFRAGVLRFIHLLQNLASSLSDNATLLLYQWKDYRDMKLT